MGPISDDHSTQLGLEGSVMNRAAELLDVLIKGFVVLTLLGAAVIVASVVLGVGPIGVWLAYQFRGLPLP